MPPVPAHQYGDMHSRRHQRAFQALEEAGLPPAQARAVLPASALPRRWETLGDVVLAEAAAQPKCLVHRYICSVVPLVHDVS